MKNDKRVLVYVNFAPYVNAGKILDYIKDNFKNVLVFSFNFYSLGKTQDQNNLSIYKYGKLVKKYYLYQLRMDMPISLIFLFLPIRSMLIFFQIVWYLLKFKKIYKKYNLYFTVNAFPAWSGNLLKRTNLIDKTIYWVWDYYPPIHSNKIVMLVRWMYWQLDRSSAISDRIVYLNQRLIDLRKNIGAWSKKINYKIIPIGTDPVSSKKKGEYTKLRLVFIGVLKRSQGLDLVFDRAAKIKKLFPHVHLDIIGSGPDEAYFKEKAGDSEIPTKFHGFLPQEKDVEDVISQCHIGIATYIPEESNVSYFGDPSKIKLYLSQGLPVITTEVFVFSEEIRSEKAGVVIDYFKPHQLETALREIISHMSQYETNALRLARKYAYKKIYRNMFNV